jgi:transcriptional regulator with XRE-family HTH domain
LRKRRGFSQSQLAMQAAGCVARTYLSKAECGHVLLPLSKLLPIAKALGLTAVILPFEASTSLAAHQSNDRR